MPVIGYRLTADNKLVTTVAAPPPGVWYCDAKVEVKEYSDAVVVEAHSMNEMGEPSDNSLLVDCRQDCDTPVATDQNYTLSAPLGNRPIYITDELADPVLFGKTVAVPRSVPAKTVTPAKAGAKSLVKTLGTVPGKTVATAKTVATVPAETVGSVPDKTVAKAPTKPVGTSPTRPSAASPTTAMGAPKITGLPAVSIDPAGPRSRS